MPKIVAQNIVVLYFLFLLTLYYEVVHNSKVIVIFFKFFFFFLASSIQYCNCDDNNVHVLSLVYDYCHVLSPIDFFLTH